MSSSPFFQQLLIFFSCELSCECGVINKFHDGVLSVLVIAVMRAHGEQEEQSTQTLKALLLSSRFRRDVEANPNCFGLVWKKEEVQYPIKYPMSMHV